MSTYLAFAVLMTIFAISFALLERTHRRTAGLPRAPFGADLEGNADLRRVVHDLDLHR